MPAVFINYRTDDEEATATLFEWELSRRFGTSAVFRASASIRPGTDYEVAILSALRSSTVLLAVIGRRWLHARDEHGRRLLDKRTDWPRREIIEAFRHGLTVVPVLVGPARRLTPQQLPTPLRLLAQCQYVRFDHRTARDDLRQLENHLTNMLPTPADPLGLRTDTGEPGVIAGGGSTRCAG